MDTSDIYVRMCDCPEIQGKASTRVGYYFSRDRHDFWHDEVTKEKRMIAIWLPRQDQIQSIMGFGIGALVNDFYEFCADELKMFDDPDNFPDSMNQLWLAFYMHEKHNKTWVGEGWSK